MSYRNYSSPYYGSYYSSYKNKAPVAPARTSSTAGSSNFRSTLSPLSTTSVASSTNSAGSGNRYGTRSTYANTSSAADTKRGTADEPRRTSYATSRTSPAARVTAASYSTSRTSPAPKERAATSYSRETSRDNQTSTAANRGDQAKSTTSSSAIETGKAASPSSTAASSYASRRATNYSSLYKTPTSATKSNETPSNNYSTSSGWTGRTYGSSATSDSPSTKSVTRSSQAPSESNGNNFLSPYSTGLGYGRSLSRDRTPDSTSPTPSYSPTYSRSASRDKTPDNAETNKTEKVVASISSLPRTFRTYNQRSTTSAALESPSTYTPRAPAYSRTATRDVGYSSSTLPAPRITSPLSEKLSRSPIGESSFMSRSAELPSINVKEHSPEKQRPESSDSDESDSEEDDDNKPKPSPVKRPPSKEKSPPSKEKSPPTKEPLGRISSSVVTPRTSYLKSTSPPKVQTDESERAKRLTDYPGNVSPYSRSSASPYSNRYYGRYTSPSRKASPGPNSTTSEDKKSVKGPSPPISALSKPPIPVGCKEYRKSPLNVDLDDHQATEFRRRQEEFREAQRRAKRQARKSSGGSTSASPGPTDSRRNSVASEKSSSSRSASGKAQQAPVPTIVKNASRKKIPSISSMINSSRSSSCSSSASSSVSKESKASDKIKSPLSNSSSNNRLQPSRKGSTSSESGNRLSASRLSSGPGSPPVLPRPPSGSKSRSPSVAKSQTDEPPQIAAQTPPSGSRSQSRSPSVNWSLLMKMTRGPLDRSSTSPESLASKSSSSHRKQVKSSLTRPLPPDCGSSSTSRSSSGRALRVPSSGSLPPPLHQAPRSGRTTASSSRSHIPSRNASARSIARVASSSTDSSTSTEPERVKHSRSTSRVKDSKRNSVEPCEDSSFAAKIASSFSWLRRQNSDVAPWWLPSTEDVPATLESAAAQETPDESSTSSSSESKRQQQETAAYGWVRRQNSDVSPWWLPSTDDVPAIGDQTDAIDQQAHDESVSSSSASKEKQAQNNGKIRRQDSEVIPWWLPSTEDVPALANEDEAKDEASSASNAKQAPSFGWLRKQDSEVIPWWLPSTDNVPELEQQAVENVAPPPVDDSSESTSSADETDSSDVEEESESSDDKRDDTDVEVEDLPDDPLNKPDEIADAIIGDSAAEKASSKSDPGEELGDRSSPDGFEWPDCPPTPPMIRSYPFYRRPPSPYDNVDPSDVASAAEVKPANMHTAWGMDALRALDDPDVFGIKRYTQPEAEGQRSDWVKSDGKENADDEEETDESDDESQTESKDAQINDEKVQEVEGESEEESGEVESDEAEADVNDSVSNRLSKAAEESEETDSSEEEDDDNDAKLARHNDEDSHKFAEDEDDRDQEESIKEQEVEGSLFNEDSVDHADWLREAVEAQIEDATFQVYKDGDYGNYLDVEASLNEQSEELEGFLENRKNSIVLRTQLSVRVHAIMDKLLHAEGRELRRALFSLKQIFQEDKDLVHEFVQNDGLACLIRVGQHADQNYQNYILRALGQVMLYVDGMNGVMEHNPTVQWLYSLIASKFRLVAKTALKLLLVFVEYVESNCQLLVKAIEAVDAGQDAKPWSSLMRLLLERDSSDSELLTYAVTLINKTLHGLSDQDSYYDQVEHLEAQGMQQIVARLMASPGTDAELLQQLEIYELELKQEEGDSSPYISSNYSNQLRHVPRTRSSYRKSPRQQNNQDANSRRNSFQLLQTITADDKVTEDEDASNVREKVKPHSQSRKHLAQLASELNDKSYREWSTSSDSSSSIEDVKLHMMNGSQSHVDLKGVSEMGVTPALRRRRERAERQRSLLRDQEDASRESPVPADDQAAEGDSYSTPIHIITSATEVEENWRNAGLSLNVPPISERISNLQREKDKDNVDRNLLDISREASVKDLTERLQANHISLSPLSPTEDKANRFGELSGIISKAKEELIKSKSRHDLRNLSEQPLAPVKAEPKKSENELHWESLLETLDRPLQLCDLDFTDLLPEEDSDPLNPSVRNGGFGPPPPPPPPAMNGLPPPPMPGMPPPPPPSSRAPLPPPTFFGIQLHKPNETNASPVTPIPKKSKKTVKLFWREIRDDQFSLIKGPTLWDELKPVPVDTQKLEHLFESRSKDLISKRQQETTKNKELIVLDPKRSNSINIGMTKLPPPRTIKTAILKMDSTIINREGIEKLLTMLPTDEERAKIQEAQLANPELPLGSAEQFLLSLASITELTARLKLWLFKSDYENMEKELVEPLMDLKQGIEILQTNTTFRTILATLLAVGNFLNGAEIKGFQVDYLAKVPEVKDTVHKHSLLHHLCYMIMEQTPETTDLYSEIGALTRASRVDFDELSSNLSKMEEDCKASWDYLRAIAKHDGNTAMKNKMSEFLTDCAERIMVATIIHRRVMNRFRKFLLWLGTPPAVVRETKPGSFCRIVSEFALEYRTTRDRVMQQLEKKANCRERNKTRGKMITQVGNGNAYNTLAYEPSYRSKEDRADAELRQLLGSDISDTESMRTGTWGRSRKPAGFGRSTSIRDDYLTDTVTDGDDEILESLVKSATRTSTHPRERKRSNRQHMNADRSSALKRSRTRDNNVFQPLPEESRQ